MSDPSQLIPYQSSTLQTTGAPPDTGESIGAFEQSQNAYAQQPGATYRPFPSIFVDQGGNVWPSQQAWQAAGSPTGAASAGSGGVAGNATSASGTSAGGMSNDQQSALAIATTLLGQYGITGGDATTLANWMWAQHTAGYSDAAISDLLLVQPIFQAHFPEIAARQKAGLPPISAGDIVSYKNQAYATAQQYGIPKNFTDQFMSQWIINDVSQAEVGQRLQDYAQAAYQSNPAVVNQLQQLYGVTPGELVAFFADPTTALPIITQRFQSAQIAGQAQIAGYGQLSQGQAETLAQQGVTQSQAQQGFQQLGLEQQWFQALPGQTGQPGIDMQTQLGAQFMGNAADIRTIQLEALRRQAAFQGGGAFAGGSKGLTGVGTEQGAQA